MKMVNFDDIMVIGNLKYKLLLHNLDIVINDCNEACVINEIWANDIIQAFKASGYNIIEDPNQTKRKINDN